MGERVLVADPDAAVAGTLTWLLREQGFAAEALIAGEDVVQRMRTDDPALVLLDGDAPAAQAVIARIRGDDALSHVRVIAGSRMAVGEQGALLAGADGVVAKPYRVPELLSAIRTQLQVVSVIVQARQVLARAQEELRHARAATAATSELVDIVREVTGDLTADELHRVLARRLASFLGATSCRVVVARRGDPEAMIVDTHDDLSNGGGEIILDEEPALAAALSAERPMMHANGRPSIVLPYPIDRDRIGAVYVQRVPGDTPFAMDDLRLAEVVVRSAASALRSAQALASTRADNRRLEALATTDPLTRLLNRRALIDRLDTEVDRAKRFESELTLLMLDGDHFKRVNDEFGHLAGDDVLRQMAGVFNEIIRRVDIVARYGGEEFVFLLPETGVEGATVFAERVRDRMESHAFDVGADAPLHLTVSIGMATFPGPGVDSADDLLARADAALYRAKAGGRNQVRC